MTKRTAVKKVEKTMSETVIEGLNKFFALVDSVENITITPSAIVDAIGRDVITEYAVLPTLLEEGIDNEAVATAKLPSEMVEFMIPGVLAYMRGAAKLADKFTDPKVSEAMVSGLKEAVKITYVPKPNKTRKPRAKKAV